MRSLSWKLAAGLLVTTAAFPVTTQAQAANDADMLTEIVVTARKRSESLQAVPESVSVMSSALIENAGITSVEDFSRFTPNVNINNGNSPTYSVLTARGITTPQGAEPPMALVIDGVQLSDLTFLNVDLINLERIEVLRGPQGSLYGRNAIAGAINITTAKPTNDLTGMVKLGYADGNDRLARASIAGPITGDGLYFSLSGSYRKSDGTYANDPANRLTTFPNPAFNGYFPPLGTRRDSNTVDDKSVRGALIHDDGGALKVELRASYTDSLFGATANELVLGPADLNDGRPHLATNLDLNQYRKLYEGSLKIDYDFGGVTLSSVSYRNRARQDLVGDGDFSTLPVLAQHTGMDIDAFSQELRLASDRNDGFSWLVGSYFQDRKSLRTILVPFETLPLPPLQDSVDHNRSRAYAFFGQTTTDLGTDFQLTLGLRYDHDRRSSDDTGSTAPAGNAIGKSFSALQPKLSLKYDWDEDFQSYVTVARGFRSGGFNAAASPQREYAQETNWSYELGFKGTFLDRRLFLTGAVYTIDLKNEQIYFITTNPPAQNLTNIARTTKTGFELEMTARPVPGLDITMGIGTADGIINSFAGQPAVTHNKTPQANGYTLNGSVQYRIPLNDSLSLRPFASVERRGAIYWSADNSFRTGPKDILDLRLFLEGEEWSVGAYARNVTNTRYPTVVAPNGADYTGLGGPVLSMRAMNTPRTYGVEASHRF